MRKILPLGMSVGALFAVILPSTGANAQSIFNTDWRNGNYIQGNLGAVFTGETHVRGLTSVDKVDRGHDAGFFASGLVGHELGRGFSVEGEAVYANSDIHRRGSALLPAGTDRSVSTYGALANLKYELPTNWNLRGMAVSPYVAAGVGYGGVTYDLGREEEDDGLLWQVKTGVALHLNPRTTLDVGYRYLNGPQLEATHDGTAFDAINLSSHQHIASVGMRWKF